MPECLYKGKLVSMIEWRLVGELGFIQNSLQKGVSLG